MKKKLCLKVPGIKRALFTKERSENFLIRLEAIPKILDDAKINLTTPINAAIIMTTNPILVIVISAFLIGEKITPQKVLGIFFSLFFVLIFS